MPVLEGRIEPVKLVDGIEPVVGVRHPGDIFGEVPLALGTVFPVGFRAAEKSRIMRVEAPDYHAVASHEPDVAKEVGRLAAYRMSGSRGLQGLAADPPPPRALVVGHRWDPSCADLRHFLERNQITFNWVTPDAPEAAEQWGGPLPDDGDLPTIRIVDGKTVVRPQHRRVAELVAYLGQWETPYWVGDENRGSMRRIGFEGRTVLNRHDFGVSWQDEMPGGGVVVSNELLSTSMSRRSTTTTCAASGRRRRSMSRGSSPPRRAPAVRRRAASPWRARPVPPRFGSRLHRPHGRSSRPGADLNRG